MFDHTHYDKMRAQYGGNKAFPEVYDKVKMRNFSLEKYLEEKKQNKGEWTRCHNIIERVYCPIASSYMYVPYMNARVLRSCDTLSLKFWIEQMLVKSRRTPLM